MRCPNIYRKQGVKVIGVERRTLHDVIRCVVHEHVHASEPLLGGSRERNRTLNRGEVGVLSALRTVGPPHRLSPTQLFKGLMLSSAGMTSRLDRLEARDLVVRRADPADRRGILVELTPKGKELVEAAVVANTAREREILAGLR